MRNAKIPNARTPNVTYDASLNWIEVISLNYFNFKFNYLISLANNFIQ